jgi:hypothetical protein
MSRFHSETIRDPIEILPETAAIFRIRHFQMKMPFRFSSRSFFSCLLFGSTVHIFLFILSVNGCGHRLAKTAGGSRGVDFIVCSVQAGCYAVV